MLRFQMLRKLSQWWFTCLLCNLWSTECR